MAKSLLRATKYRKLWKAMIDLGIKNMSYKKLHRNSLVSITSGQKKNFLKITHCCGLGENPFDRWVYKQLLQMGDGQSLINRRQNVRSTCRTRDDRTVTHSGQK